MENNLYSQFKNLGEKVQLSESEKEFHLTEIYKIMDKTPNHIPSPFYFGFIFERNFIVSTMAVLLVFSIGLTVSAENSLPNQYLYGLKTKVAEPLISFLTPTAAGKTRLGVLFINRRLEEFSKLALAENINPEAQAAFMDQFSSQVKSTQAGIRNLIENENTVEAAKTVNNLKSVLSAHDIILKKINKEDAEKKDVEEFSHDVTESLESTTEISDSLTAKVKLSDDEERLEIAIDKQEQEVETSLLEIEQNIEKALKSGWKMEKGDKHYIEVEISRINNLIEVAKQQIDNGNKREAYVVYNQANQRIGEMRSLILADQKLELEVIGDLVPLLNEESGENVEEEEEGQGEKKVDEVTEVEIPTGEREELPAPEL